jgi:8-oxo-dGTP pyrophosphatase MutT (NUDIX family)
VSFRVISGWGDQWRRASGVITVIWSAGLAPSAESSETSAGEHEPAERRTRHEHATASGPGGPAGGVPGVIRRITRPSARVLVVGPGDTLLLLQYRRHGDDDDPHHWLTPGGGIGPGESVAEAAARELREETGIEVAPANLGPVVAYSSGEWATSKAVFDAHDSYFLVRLDDTAIDTSGQEELERSLMIRHHWWTLDELEATSERVIPPNAASLVRSLLADGSPDEPIRLPWR